MAMPGTSGAFSDIPQSRGMPTPVRWLIVAGIVVIFYMGYISTFFSRHFHVWPASATTKVDLPGHF